MPRKNAQKPLRTNSFRIEGSICLIDVSTPKYSGIFAMIDRADIDLVLDGNGRWYAHFSKNGKFYVSRRSGEKLHRHVLGAKAKSRFVDHRDNNGLNNMRANIRLCTHKQNQRNKPKYCGTSKFKGVSFFRQNGKWMANISKNCRRYYLGLFESEEAAARAYDKKAKALFGEFASLNFAN